MMLFSFRTFIFSKILKKKTTVMIIFIPLGDLFVCLLYSFLTYVCSMTLIPNEQRQEFYHKKINIKTARSFFFLEYVLMGKQIKEV